MSKRRFSGAFATTKGEDGCGIWAWMIKELNSPSPEILKGCEMDDFIATLWNDPSIQVVYFHGLKYYAYFISSFLLGTGEFKYVRSVPEARDMTLTAMIMPGGDFFAIDIYFEVKEANLKTKITPMKSNGKIYYCVPLADCKGDPNKVYMEVLDYFTTRRNLK